MEGVGYGMSASGMSETAFGRRKSLDIPIQYINVHVSLCRIAGRIEREMVR
jgi:hypothetical protein